MFISPDLRSNKEPDNWTHLSNSSLSLHKLREDWGIGILPDLIKFNLSLSIVSRSLSGGGLAANVEIEQISANCLDDRGFCSSL
jgi:hypothetical protein